ncbi:MAG: hypothetical protein HY928_01910 [Elusimicrobia bacterium]|nr:hypothetical protein [Elusimicrobiota bacterium]
MAHSVSILCRRPASPGAAAGKARWKTLSRDAALLSAALAALLAVPFLISDAPDRHEAADEASLHPFGPGSQGMAGEPGDAGAGLLAPGSPLGRPSDVITMLDAPDPLAMVLRAGGRAADAPAPAPTSDGLKRTDWMKVVASAAPRGAAAAARKAGLPRPTARLAGALARMAQSAGGSGSGAAVKSGLPAAPRLSAPSSAGLAPRAPIQDSLRLRAEPSAFLASAKRPDSAVPLLASADRRMGPAGAGRPPDLRDALTTASGRVARGRPGAGPRADGPDARTAASTAKDERKTPESLERKRAELEMQKAIDLKYKKKEFAQIERPKMMLEHKLKLQETLVGAAANTAGGLVQSAFNSATGQGGDAETAYGAHARAAKARTQADASGTDLGAGARGTAAAAQTLSQSSDRFLAPSVAPVIGQAAQKLESSQAAYKEATGSLGAAHRDLGEANAAIAEANTAGSEREQDLGRYYADAARRISSWQIEGFTASGGAAPPKTEDASPSLETARRSQAGAGGKLASADGSSARAAPGLEAEQAELAGIIRDPKNKAQLKRYPASQGTLDRLGAEHARLRRAQGDYLEFRWSAGAALEKSKAAAALAAQAEDAGLEAERGASEFSRELTAAETDLGSYALMWKNASALGDEAVAEYAKQGFVQRKTEVERARRAQEERLETYRRRLEKAKKRLGARHDMFAVR